MTSYVRAERARKSASFTATETTSPMPANHLYVVNSLINASAGHSNMLLVEPRDGGNRPSARARARTKVNRHATLLIPHQSGPIDLGMSATTQTCAGCRNAQGPMGETATPVHVTLAQRHLPAHLREAYD